MDFRKAYRDHALYIRCFWSVFIGATIGVVVLFYYTSIGGLGTMPTFDELENPRTDLAARIIAADGVQLGTIFRANQNRTSISYKEIPQHVIDALVATEDIRFYEHSGVDVRGTLRAVCFMGTKGGASTLTQQLAKQLFTGGSKSFLKRMQQKLKEWVIAIRLERQYTKNEIIAMYLNKYDFLYQAIGINSASRIYFGKKTEALLVEEAAVLVGMLKSATIYNPRRNPKGALQRRNVVLAQMAKYGYITPQVKDSLQQLPIQLHFTKEGYTSGSATYVRKYIKTWVEDWIKKHPKGYDAVGKPILYDIYGDGLKINVTIDARMQRYAEGAVKKHLSNLQQHFNGQEQYNPTAPYRGINDQQINAIVESAMRSSERWRVLRKKGVAEDEIRASFDQKVRMQVFSWNGVKDTLMTPIDSIRYYHQFLHAGLLSIASETGAIKAWVGGIDYKYFKYDHVSQAKRQVGSTFKPFVYATAIDQLKLSPCHQEPKSKVTIPVGRHGVSGSDWTPTNTDNDYKGTMTLKKALATSVNTVTARLMDKIGPTTIIRLAKRMGVRSEIAPVASICLGTEALSLSEMVGAYSTFVNKGVYTEPMLISSIEDKNGTLLYQHMVSQRDVLSKESAYTTLNLMEGVTKFGSGKRLRTHAKGMHTAVTGYPYQFTNPIAGKTGTTQNHSDGWFIGMVPNLITGVWVGATHRATHFRDISEGQGATMALPIWALYMQQCYQDTALGISDQVFESPTEYTTVIDCEQYQQQQTTDNEFIF